jgi:hypothetical protein
MKNSSLQIIDHVNPFQRGRGRVLRPLVLFSLIALVALGVAAFASAGAPSQGMTAFALIDPNCNPDNPTQCGPPRLVGAHTRGFVSVGAIGPGDYCLTPGPGVDVVHTAAVASEEAFYSYVIGFPVVRYPTASANCGSDQLEVKTFIDNPPGLSNQIGFTVIVP